MATKTFDTAYQQLWGTSSATYRFYGQVQCTMSRNVANNTYTVAVTGIAAHCGKWNFKTHYTITLGSKSATGTIPASGSNSYSGWMPKSGWHTGGLPISVTLNGNADGSCPAINLYFKCYNSSVHWISGNKNISVSSTYSTKNIASTIQSETGGPNDRSAPSISLTRNDVTDSSLKFTGSSGSVNCTDWQYSLDGGSWTSCGWGTSTGSSLTLSKLSEANHYVRLWAKKTTNNVGAYSDYVYFDTRNPTISSASMTASSSTSATVKFKTDYDCTYSVTDSSGTGLKTGNASAGQYVTAKVTTPKKDATYTINVWRTYDTSLSDSTTVQCYSALPVINTFTMQPVNSTTAQATIKCNCKFYWRIKRPDGQYYSSQGKDKWSEMCNASTDIVSNITVTATSGTYTLEVQRYVNTNLANSTTTTCDTRLPRIDTFTITPLSSNTEGAIGLMNLKTDLSCNWTLNTAVAQDPNLSTLVNTQLTNVKVNLDNSQQKNYTVTVKRTTCSALSASKSTDSAVDTSSTTLSIIDAKTVANNFTFTVISGTPCRDWAVAIYEYGKDSVIKQFQTIHSSDSTRVTHTITNLPMNRLFELRVKAVKSANGAEASVTGGPFECTGIAYICVSPNTSTTDAVFAQCAAYINVSNTGVPEWKAAVPYVNISNDVNNPVWQYGTVAPNT